MKTVQAETSELPQTSFEREHDIEAGSPLTKAEVLRETPEQKEERVKRDIERGLRPPPPETQDRAKLEEHTRRRELERARVGADLNDTFASNPQIAPGTRQEVARKPEDGAPSNEGQPPAGGEEDDLDAHTVDELRTIAHREGAEVRHDMVKADIIKAIKKERKKG